ncbi:uncharacterized protein LOC129581035 [Paramacrobiotus metropolitanus]|uniref:uncharacterized protein LOC129581035 n=1 Tax=Paramacrobiotus metropolitanus TaxID=2943436 RepID=UPI002445D543|nr:uncharacterized protein LOC129581035 [Paramacrobiotus metropolitanus]
MFPCSSPLFGYILLSVAGLLQWIQSSTGCAPAAHSSRSTASLEDMITEKLSYYREDDLISLVELSTMRDTPDCEVRRPRLGDNVEFTCQTPKKDYVNSVTLTYQGKHIYNTREAVPAPDEPNASGHNYTIRWRPKDDTLTFTIYHIDLRSSGVIKCITLPVQRPPLEQCFRLLPMITHAYEVFASKPTPLTVTEGLPVVYVFCSIRLPLPEDIYSNIDNHVMWRHNGRIVKGPTEAPYCAVMPNVTTVPTVSTTPTVTTARQFQSRRRLVPQPFYHYPSPNIHGNAWRLEYHLRPVRKTDEGWIQCLFRPHREIDEWVMQETQLSVARKTGKRHLMADTDPV